MSIFSEKESGDQTGLHKLPVPDNLHKDHTKTVESEQRWTLVHESPLTTETEQSDELELSDIPSAAFKGYKHVWDYRDNTCLSESPTHAPSPPESPATPPEKQSTRGPPQAWGPIEAPITKECLPHIQNAYRGCPDFKLVAQYPQLDNTASNLEFLVYMAKEDFVTIYRNITHDSSLGLCIPQNCRKMIDNELHELRETIIREAYRTLGHASGEKTYFYLKDYFYWPSMRKDTMDYCRQCDISVKTIYGLPCLPGLYGLPWLTPGFLDICKYDFWLTLLTRLISDFPLR